MKQITTYIYNIKHIKNYINEKLRLSAKPQYTCQPKNKKALQRIILQRIKDEGNDCDLNDIDVSQITDMYKLFDATMNNIFKDFNGDISMWDVSNVIDMQYMFYYCEKFNGELSTWNVSNVVDMHGMFFWCEKFNCDISKWNVSKVESINSMFYKCKKFNQNLDSWNVSNVKYMYNAFEGCPTTPTWYDTWYDKNK